MAAMRREPDGRSGVYGHRARPEKSNHIFVDRIQWPQHKRQVAAPRKTHPEADTNNPKLTRPRGWQRHMTPCIARLLTIRGHGKGRGCLF